MSLTPVCSDSEQLTDSAGNAGISTSIGITVSAPTPPQVSVTTPTNGSTVLRKFCAGKANTSYQIHANVYDTKGQVGVSINVTITAR